MPAIDLIEVMEDLMLREFDAGEESSLIKETEDLIANEQPVVVISKHHYKLGILHAKTGKVVEMHQMKRITGRLSTIQLGQHIVDHTHKVDEKSPDIIDVYDDWVSEEGNNMGISALSFLLFSIINRVPA